MELKSGNVLKKKKIISLRVQMITGTSIDIITSNLFSFIPMDVLRDIAGVLRLDNLVTAQKL